MTVFPPPVCDLIHKIHLGFPRLKVVLILSGQTNLLFGKYVAAGLSICLTVAEIPKYLTSAVRITLYGGSWFSPEIQRSYAYKMGIPNQPRDQTHLTLREIAILQLSAQGKKDAVIARELHISERTLRYALEGILRKTQTDSRIEAIVYAVKRGIIEG